MPVRRRRWWLALIVLLVIGAVIGWRLNTTNGVREVVGVVVAVDGDLESLRSFDVMIRGGTVLRLVPQPGGSFDFPLPHLGTHMRSLDPVRVTYAEGEDGTLTAVRIGDA